MGNQDIDLVLSTDAKPRLKWTAELHRRFIDAVAHLGGAEKARPKSLMKTMCIPGLTLYHLKSHLQKYRLGKNHQSETSNGNGHEVHEQIEVQRHLQMRIEAQAMYLQSILKKAQDAVAGYNSSSVELQGPEIQNQSSPLSGLTETGSFCLELAGDKSMRGTESSIDSSLTSSGITGEKEIGNTHEYDRVSSVPSLVEINPNESKTGSSYRVAGKKRGRSNTSEEMTLVQQPSSKKSVLAASCHQLHQIKQLRNLESVKKLDLNCKYELESCLEDLDLNSGLNI